MRCIVAPINGSLSVTVQDRHDPVSAAETAGINFSIRRRRGNARAVVHDVQYGSAADYKTVAKIFLYRSICEQLIIRYGICGWRETYAGGIKGRQAVIYAKIGE